MGNAGGVLLCAIPLFELFLFACKIGREREMIRKKKI
jgi:hypothetical protein